MIRRLTICLLLLGLAPTLTVTAQDKPAEAEAAKPDPFAVPEGNDEKILNLFLRKLARTPPEDRSQQGVLAHINKIDGALDEVMSRKLTDELYVNALQLKLQVLSILPQLGDNSAVLKRSKLIDQMKQDERDSVKALAAQIELQERIQRIPTMPPAAQKKLVADIAEKLENADGEDESALGMAVNAASNVAQGLERYGDADTAIMAYKQFAAIIAKKDNPQLKELAERMAATVRRLELLGNKIEIAGPTVDGGAFNIDQLQGKVVLVDFWATWCGPCIAELPNVKNLYDAYHEKGFEVIGISLDQDVDSLKKFIEERELAWETIFFAEPENQGWNNPIARHYGISGIPTAILVNQDGNVVSLMARGENLQNELAKLLGPIEEKAAEKVGSE